jgi:hypothetical protein
MIQSKGSYLNNYLMLVTQIRPSSYEWILNLNWCPRPTQSHAWELTHPIHLKGKNETKTEEENINIDKEGYNSQSESQDESGLKHFG